MAINGKRGRLALAHSLIRRLIAPALAGSLLAGCGSLQTADFDPSVEDCQAVGFSCMSIGDTYREAGNPTMAERYYLLSARAGDPARQTMLGRRYMAGAGIRRDPPAGEYWLQQAAAQGHADAQYYLGLEYVGGKNLPKDYAKAVHWYQKAADQGDHRAQNNLGVRYAYGQGVEKNYYIAQSYYQKAAAQGNEHAIKNLASLADTMKATDPKTLKAMKAASKAAE